jgi:carbon storage regulator
VLVLTRRAGESIVIGDEVRVVVLDVRGDTVRLGIDAPRSIQVHRAEVYAEVQAANAAAATSTDDLGVVANRLQRIARPAPLRRSNRSAAPPTDPVPAPTEPVPAPTEPVPAPTEPPAPWAEPVPSSEPVPSTEPASPGGPARPKPGPPPGRPVGT